MHALMMPRLGQTMTKGKLIEWLIEVGQSYREGTVIYTIETDKTVLEVEATMSGTLLRQLAGPDDEVPVGACVGVSADASESADESEVAAFLKQQLSANSDAVRREDVAPSLHAPASGEDPQPAVGHPRAMPNVRLRARELGVDLVKLVAATKKSGLITKEDVEAFAAGQAAVQVDAAQPGPREQGLRTAMAAQMLRSWAVPQFAQDLEIDTAPLRARLEITASEGKRTSLAALILDGLVQALQAVPLCNGIYENGTFVQHDRINVGIAVATRNGLVVPVLRSCEAMDLPRRVEAMSALVQRARTGALTPDDMAEGTVTLSLLNNTRVETGVPILNAPQVCLLFCGSPVRKPVVQGDRVVVGETVHLVAVYDHRVIDGITGAQFLNALYEALAAPLG